MDGSMIKGIAIGGVAMVVLAAGGVTGYRAMTKPTTAEVIAVKEVNETIVTPREQCEDVQVQQQAPVKDPHRVTGKVAGGVVGGLVGSTIGGGTGRTVATVAGAAVGAYAGNEVQKNRQRNDVVTTTERRCKTVDETSERLIGYDVTYRLEGKEGVVRTSVKPDATLPVKDGKVVVDPPEAKP